ncbi:MAG: LysR family transcriptional regulator [Phycisphaerales bacterium]|nr:LysR family transcriptional regulator [Phycisphaerales bacterium]
MPRRNATPYYKHNRLAQLRGFCHAAQTGSFSLAAERLMLSQPSISLQVQALEREFEIQLFDRKGPKIALTSDGEALLKLAAPLVEGIDRLRDAFAAARGEMGSGALHVAAGESTILYLLPKFVSLFTAACPHVELNIHNVTGRIGLQMLRKGEADLAIGSMLDVPDDIAYEPLFTYKPMLITAPDHPLAGLKNVTLSDISAYPLILPPRRLTTWRLVDAAFKQQNLTYKVGMEVGGWEVIKKYVEQGLGISIVTSICLTGKEKLAAIPVTRYFRRRSYGVVLRRGGVLSPQARKFVETIAPPNKCRRLFD